MNSNPKVSIITTVYNGATFLEETICSVINQTYKNIEYIIIDGGSTDGTIEIIKKYENHLAYWVSEPDKGMYDGIRKGFEHATGDICAYLNSDDLYLSRAIETVVSVMNSHPYIKFLKGLDVFYNEKSFIINVNIPFFPNRQAISKHIMGSIQQESTFWRIELNQIVDWEKFSSFRLAGDHFLWHSFSKITDLYIIHSCLGGFRRHKGQLSADKKKYKNELDTFIEKHNISDIFKIFFWRLMHKVCNIKQWRYLSNGRYLIWNDNEETFV